MSTAPTVTALTSTGLVVSRLSDRIAELTALLGGVFGSLINLDPNSVDGMTVGVMSESLNNLDQLLEAVYQSFNPNTATGAALSQLVQLNNITRNPGSYSVVSLLLTGTSGTVVPAGSMVAASDGSSSWTTLTDATIGPGGTVVVTAQCSALGPANPAAGLLTVPQTPVYGWQSVTNPGVVTAIGSLQETDEQLRIRRNSSTAVAGQSMIDALYGALETLAGVSQVAIYENPGSTADANGLPAHSLNIIVLGGTAQTIVNTIWVKKPCGPTLIGAQVGVAVDSKGNNHNINYDNPTSVPIFVVVNINSLPSFPSGGAAAIAVAIVAWSASMAMAEEVIQSALYSPINTIPGVSVTSLFIGTAAAPTSSANIPIAFNALAVFSLANITVNVT